MKYWKTALSIFALSASLALAEDFRTTKGKEYKDATVSRVEPDGIVIKFHGGIVKLPFTELPSDVQKKYEYDPVAAREYAAQRDKVIPRPTATPDANLRTSEADDAQSSVKALNPAEQWVVAQAEMGGTADLSTQFSKEEDRQLSAHFLEVLLMGTRPDVRIHRHGVHIKGACIDEPIELANAQIPYEVSFERCRFNKALTFDHANFTGGLSLLGSRFKEASFNHMKVGGDAVFQQAEFEAGRPISVIVADDLKPGKPKIRKVQLAAQFTGMKVAGDAIFFSAVFDGVVFFPRIDVGGDFRGDQTKFNEVAFFTRMKIGGDAFFSGATFKGLPYFFEADIAGKFTAPGAKFQNEELAAVFHNMKVRGDTDFDGAKFDGPLDLRYADFGLIVFPRDSWPKLPAKVHMQGMRYKQISAAKDEPDSFEALLKLASQSVYSADVYGNLEEFFLRQGHQSYADRAFIERKRRERKENLHGLPWLGSWLLDWLVGYGRRPEQAGWFCLAVIGIGCVLFPLKKMELQHPEDRTKPEEDRPRYNRFWYSLGLFLPVVNLKTSEVWGPKKQCRFLRNYLRVHILLGWILVPIFLAAITGLLK